MKNVDLRELALKKVKITGNVIGKFGAFEIEQVYKNNTKDVLEVGYTFPIVETATVVGFEINVGDKVLKGKCKEKGEAKKDYLRNMVKILSNRLVYSTKPYDLTINEIHKEIRTLEELRELLELFQQPVEIKLEKREFGKKR